MACCKCCCGNKDCVHGDQGKCCCGTATKACCKADEYCCEGECKSTPCTGACCDPVFGCGQTASEAICTSLGGIWLGYGVPCDPDPCDCTLCAYKTDDGCGYSLTQVICGISELECTTFYNGTWHLGPALFTVPDEISDDSYHCNAPLTIPGYKVNPCNCEHVSALSLEPKVLTGPGTELKALLAKIGITASPGCSCNKRAETMNKNGIEWCEQNVETICDWLQEEATKRKLPFLRAAGKVLINLAIKRAKKGNKK